jgi:opacity protein-like surface antigen
MLRKLLIASAIAAVSTQVAFATGAPYIGAALGSKVNTSTYVNFRGVPINIMAGYGATIGEGIYLGGEVFSTVTDAEVTDNGLKSTFAYGVSIVPGLFLSDHTMGYVRAGIMRTRFSPSGLGNVTVSGGQFGLGIQTNLMQNWDLRGEYDYDAYGSISGLSGNPRGDDFTLAILYKFE